MLRSVNQQPTDELARKEASSALPSASTASSAAKTNCLKYWVARVREAFPHYRRREVESYLGTAASFLTLDDGEDKDEFAFRTVMRVLAEEGKRCSSEPREIPDARFAAAAIGGSVENINENTATTGSIPPKRKVASLECQCCFVEYEFNVMVSCRSGSHLFCMECLRKQTEQRVFGIGNFGKVHAIDSDQKRKRQARNELSVSNSQDKGNALELLCMAPNCVSGFDDRVLQKALPDKVFARYEELRYHANIECANMPDVSKCPKCNFTAAIANYPDPRRHPLFHCPKCRFKSCRSCGEEFHPEIARCDLVETKIESSGRNKVEEAMTSALVRICPRVNCRKPFLKSDGCNKMKCPCGCLVCNVCRVEIPTDVGYAHFCRT
jgi:TRIAD3 protein (E3 ubiquitin-protein ligase RNF216)